jgi:hypothetical protein
VEAENKRAAPLARRDGLQRRPAEAGSEAVGLNRAADEHIPAPVGKVLDEDSIIIEGHIF